MSLRTLGPEPSASANSAIRPTLINFNKNIFKKISAVLY
jgi:hypothetical protein